jgi:hypothetical protein
MAKVSTLEVVSSIGIFAVIFASVSVGRSEPPVRWNDEGGRFKPIVEADLPEGFPTYTPVGQIEVKKYPAYRKAETSGRVAFWSLFNHIKENQIAMTAPVEMTLRSEEANRLSEQSMAFLYGNPAMGTPGRHGTISVSDMPDMTVVSIGVRGTRTGEAVNEAHERLQRWLKENRDQYITAGPVRVMGYNSPFVPRDRQFFEIQIPIKEIGTAAKANANHSSRS